MTEDIEDSGYNLGAKKLRLIRVRSVKGAMRLLTRILSQLQEEGISENKAKTIAYVCNSFAKLFELSEFERRISQLEEKMKGGKS